MVLLEPSMLIDIVGLLIGVFSMLLGMAASVFTTLDWQILVGLVLAVLILVVIFINTMLHALSDKYHKFELDDIFVHDKIP